MILLHQLSSRLQLVSKTLHFAARHFAVILGFGIIAAFGRVIQLGGFGQISSATNIILEVVVELVRLLIFLYVLGLADFRKGISRIRQFFSDKDSRKVYTRSAWQQFKTRWPTILLNFFAFLGIAWAINYLIDLLAYQTCLYLTLKQNEILSHASSEWTIILFFKNISVIPLMLTFEAVFLLWMVGKFSNKKVAGA